MVHLEGDKCPFRGTSLSLKELFHAVVLRQKWVLIRKECKHLKLHNALFDWSACINLGFSKAKKSTLWFLSSFCCLTFNIDGATRCQLGPARVGGVLHSVKGGFLFFYFICSLSVELSKTLMRQRCYRFLEALHYYSVGFIGRLIAESAHLILFPG